MYWMQTLSWLHAEGRAHGDLKHLNIKVSLGHDFASVEDMQVLDFGCSSKYKGGPQLNRNAVMS